VPEDNAVIIRGFTEKAERKVGKGRNESLEEG
jgi:hypothetical protein